MYGCFVIFGGMGRIVSTLLLWMMCASAYAQKYKPYIQVLGIAQDGGYPHMGCAKQCCEAAWKDQNKRRHVVCLALVDPAAKKWWLLEATPDIKEQLHNFQEMTRGQYNYLPDGIFITHAHIGHYAGLMELGREVMNTRDIPVYALPKMQNFLATNGPWSQLVTLHNIKQETLKEDSAIQLTPDVSITAFTVPHRDEYSETAGFSIITSGKKYVFIPDINKWDKWSRHITDVVKSADIALLDATFYDDTELPGRKMSEVPHPFVKETMQLFNNEDDAVKSRIHFIHFNHTNPVLWDRNKRKEVSDAGFRVAAEGEKI